MIEFLCGVVSTLCAQWAWAHTGARAFALEMRKVDRAYPGWDRTVRSERFEAWLFNQPADTRALGRSRTAADAIELLRRYWASVPN